MISFQYGSGKPFKLREDRLHPNFQLHELLTAPENNNKVFPSDILLSGGAVIHLLISQHMGYSLHMYKGKVNSYILKMMRVTLYMVRIVQYIDFTNFKGQIINSKRFFVAPKKTQQGNKNVCQYFMIFITREKPWRTY